MSTYEPVPDPSHATILDSGASAPLPPRRRSTLSIGRQRLVEATRRMSVTEEEFWPGVNDLREIIQEIRTFTRVLDLSTSQTVSGTFAAREASAQRVRQTADEARERVRSASLMLERLRSGLPLLSETLLGQLSSDVRARVTAVASLTEDLATANADLQGALEESEEAQRSALARQLQIIDSYLDDATARNIVDQEGSAGVLARIGAAPGGRVAGVYVQARERHAAIESIVAGVAECRQLMADLLILIARQTTLVDTIENNVQLAKHNVTRANKELSEVIVSQRKKRKWRVAIVIIASLFIIILLIVIFTS